MQQAFHKSNLRLDKLEKRLRRQTGKAIEDFNMIEDGDKVMVCLSGGKDSYTMLDILLGLQVSAPINFELAAVNLDQKQPGFPEHILPRYLTALGVPFHILEQDTYSVVKRVIPEGKTLCGLCSRLRRGSLYTFAGQRGFTKIALGHHRDDILETFFMNLFHGGKLQTMPPKLRSDDGKHVVIRPLAYCGESDIANYANWKKYPIIPCILLGTVTGMINVFKTIARVGTGQADQLSNGISQALITTAVGLSIAIPALVAYNYFQGKAEGIITDLERESLRVLRGFYGDDPATWAGAEIGAAERQPAPAE